MVYIRDNYNGIITIIAQDFLALCNVSGSMRKINSRSATEKRTASRAGP